MTETPLTSFSSVSVSSELPEKSVPRIFSTLLTLIELAPLARFRLSVPAPRSTERPFASLASVTKSLPPLPTTFSTLARLSV